MNSSSRAHRFAPLQREVGATPDFPAPKTGRCMVRFVGFYELGQHEYDWAGNKSVKTRVRLEFELVGDKHPPFSMNGKTYPLRVFYDEAFSMHGSSNLRQIFELMRGDREDIAHFVDMLGEGFIGVLEHSTTFKYGKQRVYGKLKVGNKPSIRRPFIEEDGQMVEIEIPSGISPVSVFSWDHPSLEEYEEAPPGVKQQIRSAKNFMGSPIHRLLREHEEKKLEKTYERPRRFE